MASIKIWEVPKSSRAPEGYKYSLVYMDSGKIRLLGFDNAEGKGHHRHDRDHETTFRFSTPEDLVHLFWLEVQRLRGIS